MGFFFDRLFHGKGAAHLPSNAALVITEQGKDKLQEYGGDPKGRILLALETRGSSDVTEISSASGLSRGEVERMVPVLLKSGYVRFVTSGAVAEGI